MPHREPDDETISRVIEHLYDAVADDSLWSAAIEGIARESGGSGVIIYGVENDVTTAMPSGHLITPGLGEIGRIYIDQWIDRAPLNLYMKRNPIFDRACWDGGVLDHETIERDPFYNDYTRAYGLKHGIIRARRSGHVIVSPFSEKAGPPSETSLKVFDLLSGHALKALAMRARLGAAEGALTGVAGLLGSCNCGVVIIDSLGHVAEINDMARQLMGDGFVIRGRRIVASSPDQQPLLDRLVARGFANAAMDNSSEPIALKRPSGLLPLLVTAVPVHDRGAAGDELLIGGGGVIVTIVDPAVTQQRPDPHAFVLLGLTEGEAKVASIVGSGASPETASSELGLSIGTVRIHLNRIFSKLGISRQSELTALAGRLIGLSRLP
jgi:DNA-binding CsgD family transcriptional regulator